MSESKSLANKLALVTGATGGIGKATCHALAELGCSAIAIHYHANADAAATLERELGAKGVKAQSFKADLKNYDQVRSLHADVVRELGHPNVLINNAGTTLKHGVKSIADISIEEFEETWRANCSSAYLLTQLSIPQMEKDGWGRIVFVSSVAGLIGGVVGPHYASSKSALHGLIHWLAQTYCKSGITVNGVAPALIAGTAMLPGNSEELAKKIPIGRLGTTEEIADTIAWMVKTGFLTNKIITIDGGLYAR